MTYQKGVLIGEAPPLRVCSRCGPTTLGYAGRIVLGICDRCAKQERFPQDANPMDRHPRPNAAPGART